MRRRFHALMLTFTALCFGLLAGAACADTSCDRYGPRIDCGYSGMSQAECEGKGCCWAPAEFPAAPHVDLPWCFCANAGRSEYRATCVEEGAGGGVHADLELSRATQPELGPDVQALSLNAAALTSSILRLRLTDADSQRWEVPHWLFKSDLLAASTGSSSGGGRRGSGVAGDEQTHFRVSVEEEPFSIEVARCASEELGGGMGATLFNTTGLRLLYKDQYLELTTWLSPSAVLFGAGERASRTLHLERNGLPRPIWSHDLGPSFLEQNMYGSHPFVMALEADGSAWGMLLLSSNAMDIVPTEDRLSWRVTGGVLDLFLLAGPTPLDVMDQLTQVVGRPAMMPHWSLGWHQCKYGYRTVWEVEAVVANYSAAGLPLEAIWTDIDHMDGWRDFTFHPTHFPLPEMQRFVADLHSRGQRWMPIVDPGIKVDPGYPAYDEGIREDVFMRGVDGKPYLGWVWPGACHFPDFFLPRAQQYFTRQLARHREMVPWDGMWIDMNEVSNFCSGDICQPRAAAPFSSSPSRLPSRAELKDDPPWVCHLDCRQASDGELNATQRGWLHPPYDISNGLQRMPLGLKGMSVLASHHDGSVEYNAHQLYGLSECRATEEAVRQLVGRRPFVLSRASFIGAGAYAAHWTGDNSATWEQLNWSIPGVLSIGLWGIPMAGADICGFQGDTTPELCARWVSLGAFYPFARDHSDLHAGYQELYRWPEVAAAGKKALGMRYKLLPYLYTAMHAAHTTGAPLMRPLWLNFPADVNTHKVDRQFMVGEALLVSPVLQQGADSVEAYFPPGTWHSLWGDGGVVHSGKGGKTVTLHAPLGDIPLHMRGGTTLWMQQEGLTTAAVKRSPLTAVLALPDVLLEQHAEAGNVLKGPTMGAAPAAGTTTRISAHMYNDGGEELEVGASLCNFLTLNASFVHDPAAGRHSAEVLLLFGSHAQLAGSSSGADHIGQSGNGRGGSAGCGPIGDVAAAAEHGGRFEWPELAGVEVLGWHLPAEGITVDVVQRTDSCGRLAVVQRLEPSPTAASAQADASTSAVVANHGPSGLLLDLSSLRHRLECPFGLRLSWQAGGVPVAAS